MSIYRVLLELVCSFEVVLNEIKKQLRDLTHSLILPLAITCYLTNRRPSFDFINLTDVPYYITLVLCNGEYQSLELKSWLQVLCVHSEIHVSFKYLSDQELNPMSCGQKVKCQTSEQLKFHWEQP